MITLDSMTKEAFDGMMEESYKQAINGEGIELDAAFCKLRKDITHKNQQIIATVSRLRKILRSHFSILCERFILIRLTFLLA